MKTHAFCAILMLAAGSMLADDVSKDDVVNAAKKLADTGNYSWTTTIERENFQVGPTQGKIQKDGLAYVVLGGRDDNTFPVVVKEGKGAIKTEDGWESLDDAAKDEGGGFTRFMAMRMRNFKAPTDEAISIAGDTKSLTKSDDVISGDLTEDGVKHLVSFGRRRNGNPPEIKDAKGSVKFWVKDGVLSKFQYKVSGSREFNGEDRPIDATFTTEIKDVGTTKVTVPDEARSKMSS